MVCQKIIIVFVLNLKGMLSWYLRADIYYAVDERCRSGKWVIFLHLSAGLCDPQRLNHSSQHIFLKKLAPYFRLLLCGMVFAR